MAPIELHDLTTGYPLRHGVRRVSENLNAHLDRSEFTCLLGSNGAGKSTLLKTIAGYLPPLSGEVLIDGRSITSYTPAELSKKIAVVLTERPDTISMTVRDMVGIGRSPYTGFWGRLTEKDKEIVDHSMELTGVSAMSTRPVANLSDGERQKVMIAKALAQETPIILLDEPTAFLDFPSKIDIMALLKRLADEEGKTIFQSTHDVNMALQIADRLWIMNRNHGIETGTLKSLVDKGVLDEVFSGPAIEFNKKTGLYDIVPIG